MVKLQFFYSVRQLMDWIRYLPKFVMDVVDVLHENWFFEWIIWNILKFNEGNWSNVTQRRESKLLLRALWNNYVWNYWIHKSIFTKKCSALFVWNWYNKSEPKSLLWKLNIIFKLNSTFFFLYFDLSKKNKGFIKNQKIPKYLTIYCWKKYRITKNLLATIEV